MGPKVEAAMRFVRHGGRRSVITALDRIADALSGDVGTIIESPTATSTPETRTTQTPTSQTPTSQTPTTEPATEDNGR
jgi:carbamate kinase